MTSPTTWVAVQVDNGGSLSSINETYSNVYDFFYMYKTIPNPYLTHARISPFNGAVWAIASPGYLIYFKNHRTTEYTEVATPNSLRIKNIDVNPYDGYLYLTTDSPRALYRLSSPSEDWELLIEDNVHLSRIGPNGEIYYIAYDSLKLYYRDSVNSGEWQQVAGESQPEDGFADFYVGKTGLLVASSYNDSYLYVKPSLNEGQWSLDSWKGLCYSLKIIESDDDTVLCAPSPSYTSSRAYSFIYAKRKGNQWTPLENTYDYTHTSDFAGFQVRMTYVNTGAAYTPFPKAK